ncbi:MAG: Rod shape-determining protein MreD [Cyclobacteriaceae bacterium]|nr:Rod shape-determining protein MreD [Cyclobacteriaceae bacterium]
MSSRTYIIQLIHITLYLLAQALVFNDLVLFGRAFALVYISFVLMVPLESGRVSLLLMSFVMGFLIDVFSDTLGVHSAATVLIAFLRPHWLNLITPRGGYENVSIPTIQIMGFQWFIVYTIPIIFVHHFALFFIEAGSFNSFFFIFKRILLSSLFNLFLIIVFQYFFYRNVKSI